MENTPEAHQRGTCLTNDLLLEVECGTNDGDSVGVEISAVLARRGVHCDKLLQF